MEPLDFAPLKAELKRLQAAVQEGHLYRGAGGARLWRYLRLLRERFGDAPFRLLEIGMNGGHSAFAVLETFPQATVTSLDICSHCYTAKVAAWLQARHPARHRLVVGDSRQVLPLVAGPFDAVFVDGGHAYVTAKSDLANLARFAPALVVMDDVLEATRPKMMMKTWQRGPTRAWFEAVAAKRVLETEHDADMTLAWGLLAPIDLAPGDSFSAPGV